MDSVTTVGDNLTSSPTGQPPGVPADARTARVIWVVGGAILILIGTVGNVLVLCVMLRKACRKSVACVYLATLAVLDLLCLYCGLLRHWVVHAFGVDLRTLTDASCKVHPMFVYFALHFEAWTLVNISIERFFSVYYPISSRSFFTKRRASLGLFITGVCCLVLNVHHITGDFLGYHQGERVCFTRGSHAFFGSRVWPWLDLVLASLGPFIIMIVMNTAIIVRIYRTTHASQGKKGGRRGFSLRKVNHMTTTLLCLTFLFVVTTLPLCVHLVMVNINYDWQTDSLRSARQALIFAATCVVSYVNNSVNFFLYCLSARRFRAEFLAMFSRKNQVSPETTQPHTTQTAQF